MEGGIWITCALQRLKLKTRPNLRARNAKVFLGGASCLKKKNETVNKEVGVFVLFVTGVGHNHRACASDRSCATARFTCHNCKKFGHFVKDCKEPKVSLYGLSLPHIFIFF